jgi:hypothetical protein
MPQWWQSNGYAWLAAVLPPLWLQGSDVCLPVVRASSDSLQLFIPDDVYEVSISARAVRSASADACTCTAEHSHALHRQLLKAATTATCCSLLSSWCRYCKAAAAAGWSCRCQCRHVASSACVCTPFLSSMSGQCEPLTSTVSHVRVASNRLTTCRRFVRLFHTHICAVIASLFNST